MDDDEFCGVPGPGGTHCTLPKGHEIGDSDGIQVHAFAIELTPDIGQMIDRHIQELERAKAHYVRAARWDRLARWLLYLALAANIFGALVNIVGIAT